MQAALLTTVALANTAIAWVRIGLVRTDDTPSLQLAQALNWLTSAEVLVLSSCQQELAHTEADPEAHKANTYPIERGALVLRSPSSLQEADGSVLAGRLTP